MTTKVAQLALYIYVFYLDLITNETFLSYTVLAKCFATETESVYFAVPTGSLNRSLRGHMVALEKTKSCKI